MALPRLASHVEKKDISLEIVPRSLRVRKLTRPLCVKRRSLNATSVERKVTLPETALLLLKRKSLP